MPNKNIFILFILIMFLPAVLPKSVLAADQNFSGKRKKQVVEVKKPLSTLTVGEKMAFDVFWMGAHVGVGTLEVKEKVMVRGREAFHVIAIARTNDFLSKLYPVHDEVHSFIDAEKFCSLEFRKILREGRYRADETVIYDYANKKSIYDSAGKKEHKEKEILSEVHDIVSAFYWFRLQNVRVGDSLKTLVNNREKDWGLEIKILKTEAKELRGRGVIHTILVEPLTSYKEILYQRGRVWVNFTSDERRVPVWISFKTPFGPVNGVLRGD